MQLKATLRRYTDLAAVLRILNERAITLLPPSTWDDRNDRGLMAAYQSGAKLKTVLAICLAEAGETYHHWKVFSSGKDGMCVVFNKEYIQAIADKEGLRHKSVSYYTLHRLREREPQLGELPFSKRTAYKDEREYRLVFESSSEIITSKDVRFPVVAVERVLVNPWLPSPLVETIKSSLKSIKGFERLTVSQSSVIDTPAWKELAEKHADYSNIPPAV
jgi:hypothetical protein